MHSPTAFRKRGLTRLRALAPAIALAFAPSVVLSAHAGAAQSSPVATIGWTQAAPLPADRSSMGVATGSDGLIYSVGGLQDVAVATVQAYDPDTGVWSALPAMPTARSLLGAATGSDGRIYAIGGFDGTNPLDTVEIYDPSTDAWTAGAAMPTARSGLAVVTGPDGFIYA